MAEEKDYERVGRMLYGMQRACGGEEGLRALRDDPHTPPEVAAQAAALADRYRALLERVAADGGRLAEADANALIAAVKALDAARGA